MKKYILGNGDTKDEIPMAWEFLPEDAIELVDKDLIFQLLVFSLIEKGIIKKSMVFLKSVDSFKRGVKKFKLSEDITLGI